MTTPIGPSLPPAASGPTRAQSPEEAARQFEEVLVRQFVKTMTEGLFDESLSGEDGPGWIESQHGNQADMLADTLTKHLVDQGTLRLSDLLLRQWTPATPTPTSGEIQPDPIPLHRADDFDSLPIG